MKILVNPKDVAVLLGKGGPSDAGFHYIEAISRCEKEYQYGLRGVRIPTEYNPDHFSVGSIFHAGRARWFSLRFDTSPKAWRLIREACAEEADGMDLPVTFKAERMALGYLAEYVAHYSLLPKPKPIAAEYLLGPAPLKPDDPFFMFRTAKLDDVSHYAEAGGKLCIGESKTTGASISDCIQQYMLHGQPLLQFILWNAAKQGRATYGDVAGTILDVTQKGYGGKKCKFARHFIPFEPRVLEWFTKSMRGYLRDAAKIDWNSYARRNFSSCTRMGGRGRVACTYRDLCMFGKSATSKYVLKDGRSLRSWRPTDEQTVPPWT